MFRSNTEPLNPQQRTKARKRFEWLASFLVVSYSFVHHILQIMIKTEDANLSTMGVRVLSGGKFELRYNPAFIHSLTDEEAVFVFFHEVMHLALHHCTKRRFSDSRLGNMATDLAVNSLIPVKPGSCEPPRDAEGNIVGMFVEELKKNPMFSDIQEKQSAEWYYDYLKNKGEEALQTMSGGEELDDNELGNSQSESEDQSEGCMDDHKGWEENQLADTQVKARIDHIIRNEMWGNVSASFKEAVMAAQIKKINWRNMIRRTFGNILWKDRENTRKRPNRRTGYVHPGSKHIHVDRGLVAGDTSLSISSELLSMFISVIKGMTDFFPIDLVQFDTKITDGPRPWDSTKRKFEFSGRGGTNFEEVIKLAEKRQYKVLAILSDGEAPEPHKPKNIDVLWVLPQGKNPPVSWGKVIHLDPHG